MLPLLLVLACAPASKIDLSPEAWRQKLTAARPGEHDAWLKRLALDPVANAQWQTPVLERVEVLPAKLSGAKEPELFVVARFTTKLTGRDPEMGLSDEVRLVRAQVLKREGKGWCALSSSLSADVILEEPNAGPADGMKNTSQPPTFAFVNFSSGSRQTIEVHKSFDNLSRASARGENVEWWDLIDGKLVKISSATKLTADCMPCDVRFTRTWFEAKGPPPIHVKQFTLQCDDETEKHCQPVEVTSGSP